jgi:hypothetical protein
MNATAPEPPPASVQITVTGRRDYIVASAVGDVLGEHLPKLVSNLGVAEVTITSSTQTVADQRHAEIRAAVAAAIDDRLADIAAAVIAALDERDRDQQPVCEWVGHDLGSIAAARANHADTAARIADGRLPAGPATAGEPAARAAVDPETTEAADQ